nr:glycan-binding surface protein [uncultured Carboxylicivirga sp.]
MKNPKYLNFKSFMLVILVVFTLVACEDDDNDVINGIIPTVSGITPSQNVFPGDIIAIEGSDLEQIHIIRIGEVFLIKESGIISKTDEKLEFELPAEAPEGEVFVVSSEETIPNVLAGEITLQKSIIETVEPEVVEPGTVISVFGQYLHLVAEVWVGNVELVNITIDADNTIITATCPENIETGFLKLIMVNGIEITYPNPITKKEVILPVVGSITDGYLNESIKITGDNLDQVTAIVFQDDLVVNSIDFVTLQQREIEVIVPVDAKTGLVTAILKSTDGDVVTPEFTLEERESNVDPITPETIVIIDYEVHGGHDGSWDPGWSGGTEIVTEAENTFLITNADVDGWIMNCNHQSDGAPSHLIENVENYILKLDVRVQEGVTGADEAAMQFVLGDEGNGPGWVWFGAGLLPASTNGSWVTISIDPTDIGLSGDVDLRTGTNGLYGGVVPAGVSFDNLRFDPK